MTSPGASPAGFGMQERKEPAGTVLALSGTLDDDAVAALWPRCHALARAGLARIDISGVERCDGAGAALLQSLQAARPGLAVDGAAPSVARVLVRFNEAYRLAPPRGSGPLGLVAGTGRIVVDALGAARTGIGFLGLVTLAFLQTARRPATLRLSECARQAEAIGTRALPLVLLLGFLIGLILAFQSAVPMRQFGAEIFVANLVSMALLRELGPLMSAVILAGRSGSAFAAEIGTMKVNEEIDALSVMGLDPIRFLVLPRIIGAMLAMPVLTVTMNIAGIAGMTTVMGAFGFPASAVMRQVVWATVPADLLGGLFKAMVFGLTVALIGCRRGMQTGTGPKAVGESATSTVVGSIIAIVLLDGFFAITFNLIGL